MTFTEDFSSGLSRAESMDLSTETGKMDARQRRQKLRTMMKKYGLESGKVWGESIGKSTAKSTVLTLKSCRRKPRSTNASALRGIARSILKSAIRSLGTLLPFPVNLGEEPGPSLPPVDQVLLSKVALKMVTDKAAFCEEVKEFMTPKVPKVKDPLDLAYDYGDLEGLIESGNTAKGWVAGTMYHLQGQPGKPDVKVADPPQRLLRCFRKLNGRWYNDTEKGDFQPRDEKRASERPVGRDEARVPRFADFASGNGILMTELGRP